MKRIKKQGEIFLRTVYISSVILSCLVFAISGIAKAYESIRLIGFGEYRSVIEYEDETLKIFDFEFKLRGKEDVGTNGRL